MDSSRFDRISKAFAQRRLSRRDTLATGAAGIAATGLAAMASAVTSVARPTAAQEATPAVDTPAAGGKHSPTMLFVQTFQSGTITPVEGVDGRYTLTLEQGHGQTVYFSDRPDRIVGASPTPQFLEGLGFSDANPPNAALVVETAPGETDVAVVELFNPLYDPVSQGVTYEVEVLANWQSEVDLGLQEAPTDLATLEPVFAAAHLFIDGCEDPGIECVLKRGNGELEEIETIPHDKYGGFCWNTSAGRCLPCLPPTLNRTDSVNNWTNWCNRNPECLNRCFVTGI